MDLIVGHQNLDFDCVSSMVAAKKLHPSARGFLQPTAEGNVLEFLNIYRDHFSLFPFKQYRENEVGTLIVVDTNRRERLGPYEECVDRARKIIVYDHHPPDKGDLDADEYYHDSVGALITLMVEKLRQREIRPTPSEATLFLLGLHQETGGLQFGTTIDRDYEAGRYLMEAGADLDVVQNFMRHPLSDEQLSLFNDLLSHCRTVTINHVPVTLSFAETEEYVPEISLLAHKLQDTENSNMLCVLVKMGDRIQLVFRNRYDQVDAGDIAEQFGGGGHARAASATLSGITLDEARQALMQILEEQLKPDVTAGQIMSHPVHSIRPELPVEEAQKVMLRLGHHGMPITDDGENLIGIVTRSDLDKAVQHDLTHAPVKGFMNPHVETVQSDTSISQLRRLMMDKQIGRLPVVEDGQLVGIVTRTDLIRALHEQSTREQDEQVFRPPVRSSRPRPDNIEKVMDRTLSETWMDRLRRWGRLCDEHGDSLFLVGGCVRDILMEQSTRDLDLVAEENGLAFARKLVEVEGGEISAHEKFQTAVVTLPDGDRVDVATARTEYYSHPAALPEVDVEHATVLQDLGRRDFTINAMAVSLAPGEYGDLLDLYGGRRDLQEGQVRILYRTSFLEDPTRIFRAVRFAVRFGFEIEQTTRFQLKQALENEPFEAVSGDRLRDELDQALQEEHPWPVMEQMFELGILPTLHPEFVSPPELPEWFEVAEEAIDQYRPSEPLMVYYCLLMAPMEPGSALSLARRLNFSRDKQEILNQYFSFEEVRPSLDEASSNSEIYRELDPLGYREVLVARLAVEPPRIKRKIQLHLETLSRVKPLVDGNDLKQWGMKPGPRMGTILDQLFYVQLDENIESKQELKSFFQEHFSARAV